MFNFIKADFYRINRSVIYKVLFLVMAVCAVITTVASHAVHTGDMDMGSAASTAMLSDVVMLNLVNCVMAGQLICGDFENKLMQSALTGTSSRATVVCAKMVTYTALVGIMSLPYALCSIIGAAVGGGFGAPFTASTYLHMLFDATQHDVTGGMIGKFVVISLVMALVYTAQSGVVFLLAFLMKNKPLIVTIIGFILSTIIGMGSSLLGESVEKVLEYTPYCADIFALGSETGYGTLAKIAVICLVWIALFTGVSCAAFRKAEIK